MEKKFEILIGNAIDKLKEIPDKSVYTCITSPPYYALRDYGTATWVGGDPECKHYRESKKSDNTITGHKKMGDLDLPVGDAIYKNVCPMCGAVRVDEQIGLEETPEEYIQRLVEVFREVKRVLKDDGTLWVNIGDSYASNSYNNRNFIYDDGRKGNNDNIIATKTISGDIKQKDLIGIPWMLAFALRADGWYLRQDIIWHKPNPMPESVKDRCTKSHEYIFLLSKSPQYYFDSDAIKEEATYIENRLGGLERERLFGYNSKRNNNPEAYLLGNDKRYNNKTKYEDKDQEKAMRQGMHKSRGEGIVEKRYNLPSKEDMINFLKSSEVTIQDIVDSGVTKTTVEHWYRSDDGFSFPKVDDWEKCSYLFANEDDFNNINEALLDITYETDAIGKSSIRFGGNKYTGDEMSDFPTYSGNVYTPNGYRNKRDVWSVHVNSFKGAHFATFPEELIKPCVLGGCPENEIVLDTFSGSGTTGICAIHNNRKYIGIELNEEYAQMSINRIGEEAAKESLW